MAQYPDEQPGPFTYRRKVEAWEVIVIVDGKFKDYIECRTEDDAKAIANWREFQHRFTFPNLYDDDCNVGEVQRTIKTMDEYGLNHCVGYRQLQGLEKRLRGDGQ